MNAWFQQLSKLIAMRDAGQLTEEEFQEHKTRLSLLQEKLAAFNRRLSKEEAQFGGDDAFQMRILELGIEDDNMSLETRETRLLAMEEELDRAVEEAEERASMMVDTEYSRPLGVVLSPEEEASLLQQTRTMVEEIKSEIFRLRSERLDMDFWAQCNKLEEALYRNGSEPVAAWNRRVVAQRDILQKI